MQNELLSHMCQSCVDTSRLVLGTSEIGQSFVGINQAILLSIMKRKI